MKFKYYQILLLFLLMFFVECESSDNYEIIDEDKFITILADLHFTDAFMANKGFYDGNLKDSTTSYYNYVLKKHNISRASFDHSMAYYSKSTEKYLQIYDKVIEEISKKVPATLHKNSVYNIVKQAVEKAKKQ